MQLFALRLKPNQDLRQSLKDFVHAHQLEAAFVVTAIGSLQQAALRFANQSDSTVLRGKFEIVSLAGTLSVNGIHLHGSIANGQGQTIGGHIAQGCLIYTTAEIVIGASTAFRFLREVDEQTGFKELVVLPLP
jgi:predicted DNA-binding protein with PD1-like motif